MERTAERTLIVLVMVLLALAIWTVIPLGWLWIGSQISHSQGDSPGQASFAPYLVVGAGIIVSVVIDAILLGRLARRHERLSGRRPTVHRQRAWLRSLSGDRSRQISAGPTVENVMVISVLLALVAWMGWFVFAAGSPLPGG